MSESVKVPFRYLVRPARCVRAFQIAVLAASIGAVSAKLNEAELADKFTTQVRPFVENYCVKCHDQETHKGDLDLSPFTTMDSVVKDFPHWELVLERLQNGEMPPAKSKQQPSEEIRKGIVDWIQDFRQVEARKYAGDPGPVLPRRLSNAEYDYTIRDLTGVDLNPTRAFPVDPANQAGFNNSGESLAMSPALVKKYFEAAREVADHLALLPDGFAFAPHPVVADTDRDKWSVFRIVNFYKQQPTDYADYFFAAWHYRNRKNLGMPDVSLAEIAAQSKVSSKYLSMVWATLAGTREEIGPIAKLQSMWRELPEPRDGSVESVRAACDEMREYVVRIRQEIVPQVPNLNAPPIQSGSQTLVLWKDRQMAANRRRFDPTALRTESSLTNEIEGATPKDTKRTNMANAYQRRGRTNHVQAPTPDIVKKGGFALAPVLITTNSSATAKMAASKKRGTDAELIIPDDPAARAKYETAFARFAEIFPDAFYITERARVYLDAEKEQENAGRLLSAGLHSMTGYFRDDHPLYDLILDESGQKALDRLWDEFDFLSSVPQRMHTSFLWFERTDSAYLRDPEFDPYRPEDKTVTTQEKITRVGELYLAKAQKYNASETVQEAIKEHFAIVAAKIGRVERERIAAVPSHLKALENFAERAYRRPLSAGERQSLREFYQSSRSENGVEHEEAMRDCIVRVLMSPNFLFRMDLVEASGRTAFSSKEQKGPALTATRPLSNYALASRLSYFLWAGMPDKELLAHASIGDLSQPEVLKTQARRMIKDARVRNFASEFAGNWLDFRRFEEHNSVDRERFPAFNNELRAAMFEEPIHFFVNVAQTDRSVLDLLYAKDTFVNPVLARHYGISIAETDSNVWIHVENARDFGRGGVLPMAVFLTANSPGLRTSPVKRGNWVVKRILGERIPPPPPTVPVLPSDEKNLGNLTLRETLARHRDNPACAGCHARFDSFGLVFETYGPIGERRERDLAGHSVDTRAEFSGGGEGEGLTGLLEYIRSQRQDDFVRNLCRKVVAYGLGRTLILSDEPLVEEMRVKLANESYHFSSLIESVVTSPQFLTRRNNEKLAKN